MMVLSDEFIQSSSMVDPQCETSSLLITGGNGTIWFTVWSNKGKLGEVKTVSGWINSIEV